MQAVLWFVLMVLAHKGAGFLHGQLSTHDVVAAGFKGSSFVPIDSWIYPALERLAALGYMPTGSTTIRQMTRLECARLVEQARKLYSKESQGDASEVHEKLVRRNCSGKSLLSLSHTLLL